MKIKEIKEKRDQELRNLLVTMREKLQKFRFDLKGKRLKNNQEIKKTRKTIAQILTILKQRERK